MIGIYRITSPSGKSYIGQSVEVEKRWYYHKGLYGRKQPTLYNSFRKYGVNKHCFEVLIECEESMLNAYEEYFIDYFNTLVPFGLNLNSGGSNGRPSLETRLKISNAGIGRKMSDKNRINLLRSVKGIAKSDECKRKLSEHFKGKKLSKEHSAKISIALKGKVRPDYVRQKIRDTLLKKRHNPI